MHMEEHGVCRDCVAKYLTLKILKEGIVGIGCPAEHCTHVLDYVEIKESCSAAAFTRCPTSLTVGI
jgi:hypothetical protein